MALAIAENPEVDELKAMDERILILAGGFLYLTNNSAQPTTTYSWLFQNVLSGLVAFITVAFRSNALPGPVVLIAWLDSSCPSIQVDV
jgi:hypothetical protein